MGPPTLTYAWFTRVIRTKISMTSKAMFIAAASIVSLLPAYLY